MINKMKLQVAERIIYVMQQNKLTQVDVAAICNINQPRVSNLVYYKLEKFSLEMLLSIFSGICFHTTSKPLMIRFSIEEGEAA